MNQNNTEGVRKPVLYAIWAVLLVAIVAVMGVKMFNRPPPASEPSESAEAEPAKPAYSRPKPIHAVNKSEPGDPTAPATPVAGPRPKAAQAPASLMPKVEPTPETPPLWRENLARLVQNGAAALPAIQEYLALNKDVNFESIPGGAGLLGSTSLRMSLLDALGNIPGPEALAASALMLQN